MAFTKKTLEYENDGYYILVVKLNLTRVYVTLNRRKRGNNSKMFDKKMQAYRIRGKLFTAPLTIQYHNYSI